MDPLAHLIKTRRDFDDLSNEIAHAKASIKELDATSYRQRALVEGWKTALKELRQVNLERLRSDLKPIAALTFKDASIQTLYIEECIKAYCIASEAESVSLRFKISTTEQNIIEVDQNHDDLKSKLIRQEQRHGKLKKLLAEALAYAKQSHVNLQETINAKDTKLKTYTLTATPTTQETSDGGSLG